METTANLIKRRRLELNLTQGDIAKFVGVSEATVSRWESGITPNMARDKIAKLATVLQISPLDIVGRSLFHQDAGKPGVVPLLGHIACGDPILADENIEEYISLPSGVRADYALRCVGDSMIGAGIQDGDTVFIRADASVENGQIAAVRNGDEATLKRVRRTADGVILMPENPEYDPIIYTEGSAADVEIMGLAVAYLHKLV